MKKSHHIDRLISVNLIINVLIETNKDSAPNPNIVLPAKMTPNSCTDAPIVEIACPRSKTKQNRIIHILGPNLSRAKPDNNGNMRLGNE
jgi:hypothetical protein